MAGKRIAIKYKVIFFFFDSDLCFLYRKKQAALARRMLVICSIL